MHTMQRLAAAAGIAAACLAAGSVQAATEMVVNGGFETGDFSGWSESGAIGSVYGVDSAGPRNGGYSAFFGASDPPAFIAQTLATVTGGVYQVSFHFDRSAETGAGSFSASLGGVEFFSDPGAAFAFAQISLLVTAAADNSVLRFEANNLSDFYTLDDVSVTLIPEPASAALLLAGLLGIAGRLRPRRGTAAG